MAESGKKNRIYLVLGGNYGIIGGELSNSITVNSEIINISDKDSDWAKNMAGEKSWEASGSFNLDKTSPAHAGLKAGEEIPVFIGEIESSSPIYGVSGNAIIASVSVSSENNAAVTIEVSLTGNGEVTYHSTAPTTTAAPTTTPQG
jgi:predicted secreted protein